MKVAIIKHHEFQKWRAIELKEGQSTDFDSDAATRRWLWPFIDTEWHLLEIVETEKQP
jgi:hypothetical protein